MNDWGPIVGAFGAGFVGIGAFLFGYFEGKNGWRKIGRNEGRIEALEAYRDDPGGDWWHRVGDGQ